MDAVVSTTVFLADINGFANMNEYMREDCALLSSAYGVPVKYYQRMPVEIQAIAVPINE